MTSNNGRTNGRLQRPELSRDRPIRSFSTLFGPPAEPTGAKSGETTTADQGNGPPQDSVDRGVSTGYRVIEEYLQRGQRAAKAASSPPSPDPASEVPRSAKLTERMFQYASDFAAVWLELMQTLMLANPAVQSQQGASVGPFAVGEEHRKAPSNERGAHPEASLSCAVEIDSRRPVEVSWEIRPEAASADLSVHHLQAADAAAPLLAGASLSRVAHGGRFVLRLKVADDQPAGTYTGLVVDRATNLPAGALVVRISG
jgi:hypothetical protein